MRLLPTNLRHLSIVALAVTAASCSGDGLQADRGVTYDVATYNGGLAVSFVDFATLRAPAVIETLGDQEFDLLCVEEFWRDQDWEGVMASTRAHLPYSFRRPNEEETGEGGACPAELSDPLEACTRANCDVPVDQLTSCVLSACAAEVDRIATENPACFGCLTANIGKTIDEILAACGPDSSGGGSYAFDGSFGTGILSASPLVETDSLLLESTTNRRAILYAKIDETPIGPVHAFCTHLTADLLNVPYTGPFGSWVEEQALQIDAMLAYIDEKADEPGTVILLGDLNTGPAVGNAVAEHPQNYEKIVNAGFTNPYVAQDDATCSFCTKNPLNGGTGNSGVLIDHVMLRGDYGSTFGEQFMRGEIMVNITDDETATTAYSDHYGVSLTIEPNP